jgi:predicted ferric reductase
LAKALAWIALYLLLVSAPLLVLIAGPFGPMPPGRAFWWDFSMGLGFAGMAMIGVQFVLTARFKRLAAPFGIDIIYYFHRYLAIIALSLVLSHFAILWLLYPESLHTIDPRTSPFELTLGRVALVLFALAVVTSEFRKWLRLEYGLWRYLHVLFAVTGFVAATGHIVGVGYYTQAPGQRGLWLGVTLGWLALIGYVRLYKPWTQVRRPYRVVELRPERGDTYTLTIEPDGHGGIANFSPGQFAWLTLRQSPFLLREHPFSIVSSPGALPRMEFGIKALGDFTSKIGTVRPGETVHFDGPYGVFTIDSYPDAPGFVGIVGGIGITPVLSMLRAMVERGDRRPFVLFYANPEWDKVAFRDELDTLRARMNLHLVHVIEDAPDGFDGESGRIDRAMMERHLPLPREVARVYCYFLCGPEPMTMAVRQALDAIGVPPSHVRNEVFNLV